MKIRQILKRFIWAVGNTAFSIRRLRRSTAGLDRIHAGCGGYWVKDWLNIGILANEVVLYGTMKRVADAWLMSFDLTRCIPVADRSVLYLYASHFIEHLSFDEGRRFLSESYRVMKPGGLIRLTCPSLAILAKRYCDDDKAFFSRLNDLAPAFPGLATKGELLAAQFYGWEHKWSYDFESIKRALEEAGFQGVVESSFRQSRMPEIDKLEPDTEDKLMQTLYVEAMKS